MTTEEPPRLDKLNRDIPRDLVTIVQKAIDRETARRYPTAAALAGELRRFLADEPIQARRTSPTERLWCWCRRNPVVAALTAALALAFLAGFAGVTWKWRDAERQKGIARAAEGRESAQKAIATAEADRSRRLLYGSDMGLAHQAWEAGDTGCALALLERQWPRAGKEDLRGFEWRHLSSLCRDGSRLTLRGHTGDVTTVIFSPDGKTLVSTGQDKTVRLWDIASHQHVRIAGILISSIAFTPDGKTLALAEDNGKTVHFWDAAARCELATLALPIPLECWPFRPTAISWPAAVGMKPFGSGTWPRDSKSTLSPATPRVPSASRSRATGKHWLLAAGIIRCVCGTLPRGVRSPLSGTHRLGPIALILERWQDPGFRER